MRYHVYTLKSFDHPVSLAELAANAYRFCYDTRLKAFNKIEGMYGYRLKIINTQQIGLTVYKTPDDKYCFIVDERHHIFNLYIAAVGPNFPRLWSHPEITYLVLKNLVKTF